MRSRLSVSVPVPWGALLGLLGMLALLALSPSAAGAAEVELEAGFDQRRVGARDTVGFWIEVRAGFSRPPAFEADFELDNLDLLGRPVPSESFRFVNGATTRTRRLTWRLRPRSSGPAAVRRIRVEIEGETFQLPSRVIRVEAGLGPRQQDEPSVLPDAYRRRPRPGRAPSLRSTDVFLRAEVDPPDPWVGERVTYTLNLYTRADINSIYPREMPTFQGFWAHELTIPRQSPPERVRLDGELYYRAPLLRRVLYPRRPGILDIEAAEYDLVAEARGQQPFTLPGPPQQLRRRSNPVRLVVRELPPGPEGFEGAVGRFRLTSSLEPRRVSRGESATLRVTVEGDGLLAALPVPETPVLEGVTVYPPEESSTEEGADGESQQRRWSWDLVPEQVGRWTLEPFELRYFDPAAGGYRRAGGDPLTLTATAGDDAVRARRSADLHPIRSAAVPEEGSRGLHRWPWAWLAALPLALLVALRTARRRRATTSLAARRLLERLEELVAEPPSNARGAATAAEGAWREFLEERWMMPAETPLRSWGTSLEEHMGDADAARDLAELAEAIHYLRHAPQLTATAPLCRDLLDRSRRLLRRLP